MPLRRNRFRATQPVVKKDTRGDVGTLPPAFGQREQKRQRLDQMRCQRGQRQFTFIERLTHQPELQLLEVAQPAVEHLRGAARRAGGQVPRLDQRHLEPTGGSIQSASGAHYSAADHHDVELLGSESLPGDRALCRSQRRGGPPCPPSGAWIGLLTKPAPVSYSSVGGVAPRLVVQPRLELPFSPDRRAPSAGGPPRLSNPTTMGKRPVSGPAR